MKGRDKKSEPFGSAPKGIASFDGTRQTIIITRTDLPKFGSGNRMTGTAEENKATVQGTLALFGTYSYDEASKSLSIKIEGSSFANWVGAEQKRTVTLQGDTLTIGNPTTSAGGPSNVATIVWRRAK